MSSLLARAGLAGLRSAPCLLKATSPRRPMLRYHGGKWRLAQWVIAHFPSHRIYVEPFAGAASVLFRKSRSYAEVINDLDGEIVNLFFVLRNRASASELERLLRLTPFARGEFLAAREATSDPTERARRLIIRSYMSFGSDGSNIQRRTGFRNNCSRNGSTPAHDWASYPDLIGAFTERLTGVVVENRNAIDLIRQMDALDALFYCDPPYPHATRSRSSCGPAMGYSQEMSDDDHRRLADTLRAARGMVVLSGYPCSLYDEELYPDWHRVTKRSIAHRSAVRTEALWLNPSAQAALKGQVEICWEDGDGVISSEQSAEVEA